MIRTFVFLSLVLVSIFSTKVQPVPEQYLPFMEYCKFFGYPVEQHNITTEDGYILTFFRLPNNGKPVFLQHGVIDSSDTFIVNYKNQAPAFVLHDAGYDVWVGNSRGNKYSKDHVKKDINQKEFWDFTWSHMSEFDLPAAFTYISQKTGFQKIDFIGHSQGTLIMFASLALDNMIVKQYLGKFIALAPILSVSHQGSNLLEILSQFKKYSNLFEAIGIYQVLEYTDPTSKIGAFTCSLIPAVCKFGLQQISDLKPELDNLERMPVIMGHYPAGASLWDVSHFAQMMEYNQLELKRYDYGSKVNMKKYGSVVPPSYDLSKIIHSQIYLLYGKYDLLADQTDVLQTINYLKARNGDLFYKEYEAGHATFIWGQNDLILQDILDILQRT